MAARLICLTGAELFDPAPRGRRDLLVGGGQVLAVEAAGALAGSPGLSGLGATVEVIDLGGARIVPGLVDSHVHVGGGGGESGPASRVPRVPFEALTLGGVTSCVGVLGTDGTTRTMEDLVATVLGLREEGLSAWCWTGAYEVPPRTLTGRVRSDVVFVDPIVGVGELAISDHRSSQPTFDELVRIAADCHVAGLMSRKAGILHLHLGDGPRGLDLVRRALAETEIPGRVFHPTHVNRNKRLFEEALDLAKKGPTVEVTAFPVEDGEDAWSAPDAIERFFASGAPRDRITCSSDGGGCLPTYDAEGNLLAMGIGDPAAVAGALAELLRRGHPLADVLPIFTSNPATLLRLHAKGHLGVGADADLVVLDDRHRPRDVMARGRFVVRDGIATVVGRFSPTPPHRAP